MAKIPALDRPGTLLPWWMTAIVTGQSTNARLPLSHLGALPRGEIALSLANYAADTSSTSAGDPGAGNLRWNHATQSSATQAYLSDVDAEVDDHGAVWSGLQAGGHLYLYNPEDLDVWQWWSITAIVDGTGYATLDLTLSGSAGAFADEDPIVVTVQQPTTAATDAADVAYDNTTSGLSADTVQEALDELSLAAGTPGYTIITEGSAFTADPGTHDGLFRYIRAGGDVTFDNAEPYTVGMAFNIRATASIELLEDGVTLTPPAGGTLEMEADMSVQVVMTSSTAGDVIGQTVPA